MDQDIDEVPSADYTKGFNEGYLLAQYNPELAVQLNKAEGTSERLQGMKDGHKRFELDRQQSKDKASYGREGRDTERQPGKDKGRHIEPER